MRAIEEDSELRGVFVSLVTPFADERIAFDALDSNVSSLSVTDIRGYLVLGGNAEAQGLLESEQEQLLTFILERAAGKAVICGVSGESTYLTLERARRVADTGCSLIRVAPPHYFSSRMSDDVLIRYYEEVADESPIPVILYNVPKLVSGVSLSVPVVRRLARHPNIVGIKDSSVDAIEGFIEATKNAPDFAVLAGSANNFYTGLVGGAVGGDMSLANYLPTQCCDVQSLVEAGKLETARKLNLRLVRIYQLVSGRYGVPGVKAAMNFRGFDGGAPRRPLVPLEEESVAAVAEALRTVWVGDGG